ncbi:NACHT domain-containing protein [Ruminococcus albus]|uniref:Protein kinase domain-containing protein n=1 Tax=Ruminococcus albus TaxID=1264 RepID=A0A1I1R773_RUMAL|nr:hypothetical protein [Ruminococcus albus]SFD30159.1 hypothetical protein SAMN02910406_03617 [Ruminococcus albus]
MDDKREAIRLIDNGKPRSAELRIKILNQDNDASSYRFFVDECIGHGSSVLVYKGYYVMSEMRHECIIKELYPDNCDIHRDIEDGVALSIGRKDDYERYKQKYIKAYEIQLNAQSGRMYDNTAASIKSGDGNDEEQTKYSEENMAFNSAISAQLGIYESDSGILYTVYASNLCYTYDKYPPAGRSGDPLKNSAAENIKFALQAARVIAAFHKAGWLILDIKEENFIITGTKESTGIMFIDLGSLVNKQDLANSGATTVSVAFTPKSTDNIPLELRSLLKASSIDRIRMCYKQLAETGDTTDMYLLAAMLYRKLFGRSPVEDHPVGVPESSVQQPFYDGLKNYFGMTMAKYTKNRSCDDDIIKQLEKLFSLTYLVDESIRQTSINNGMMHTYTGVTDDHLYNSSIRYYYQLGSSEKFAQLEKITQKFDTKVHLLDKNKQEISADKIFDGKRHIFLKGSGGMGKSTLLYDQWKRLLGSRHHCFYIDLSCYSVIDESVEQGSIIHDGIKNKPLNILAYITNIILRDNTVSISAHLEDNKQESNLRKRFEGSDKTTEPEFVIMLDGYNELLNTDTLSTLNYEINTIVQGAMPWKNVQLVITGRKMPEDQRLHDLLENYFDIYSFMGITDTDISAALAEYMEMSAERVSQLKKDRLWELLKTPMFLNMYLEINDSKKVLHTRGEILEEYIFNREVSTGIRISFENERKDSHAVLRQFIVKYALPYVANYMDQNRTSSITNLSLLNNCDRSWKILVDGNMPLDRVLDFDVPFIQERTERDKETKKIIKRETGYCYNAPDGKIAFTHQYFRDYFAAKQIQNILSASEALGNAGLSRDDQLAFIKENGLDYTWSDDVCILLGEIIGDYKNEHKEE